MSASLTIAADRVSQTSASDERVMLLPKRMERLYSQAILIRAVEERLLDLFAHGKLFGTVHTCIGQDMERRGGRRVPPRGGFDLQQSSLPRTLSGTHG